jgi:hypothetical protein
VGAINRADYVITSQIRVNSFLEEYERLHVAKLANVAKLEADLVRSPCPGGSAVSGNGNPP